MLINTSKTRSAIIAVSAKSMSVTCSNFAHLQVIDFFPQAEAEQRIGVPTNPGSSLVEASQRTTESSSSPEPASPKVPDSHEIKEFLQSFNPSLLYLLDAFIEGGICDKKKLDEIACWTRQNLVDAFEDLTLVGGGKMKKVVVETIVLRLKAAEYYDMSD